MNKKANEGWQLCLHSITRAVEASRLEDFLKVLLTSEEMDDLSKRCLIMAELMKGQLTQRQLSSKLGVSQYKLSRGVEALRQSKINKNQFEKIILGE